MNQIEKKMLEILKRGKDHYGYLALKCEFEAEGIRNDELHRQIDLARRANLSLAIKIGGCEAVSDLLKCKQIGADYIIAPMIETKYALTKYIDAKNKVYNKMEQEYVCFLFNLETITAYENLEDMLSINLKTEIDGLVFGRVDFANSMNISRDDISNEKTETYCDKVASQCRKNDLEYVIGGSVGFDSIEFLRRIKKKFLSRFETRKIVLSSDSLDLKDRSYLKNAIEFELLSLINKQNYYKKIEIEDSSRIKMLESRLNNLNNII